MVYYILWIQPLISNFQQTNGGKPLLSRAAAVLFRRKNFTIVNFFCAGLWITALRRSFFLFLLSFWL